MWMPWIFLKLIEKVIGWSGITCDCKNLAHIFRRKAKPTIFSITHGPYRKYLMLNCNII